MNDVDGTPKGKAGCSSGLKTILKYTLWFVIFILAAFLGVLAAISVITSSTTSGSFGQSLWQAMTGETVKTDNPSMKFDIGMNNDYQSCLRGGRKKAFPDLGYVFLGYHILKGYPMAVGPDPGFTSPIFRADYSKQRQTADCAYSIPKGYTIIPDISCETSLSSKVIKSSEDLRIAMEVSAKVSGGGWGVSFGASLGYKQASQLVQNGENVFVFSKATCHYYYVKMDRISPPPFSDSFLQQLMKLNNTKSFGDYIDFINYFGTHFITGMTFGARFMKEHSMSASNYKYLRSQSLSVEVQASYSGFGIGVSAEFGLDDSLKQEVSEFSKRVETKTITVGSPPPKDGNALTWASTVKERPVPFKYEMTSIEDLFTPAYMELYPGIDMEKLRGNIKFVKIRYADAIYEKAIDGDSGCRVFNAPFVFPPGTTLLGSNSVKGSEWYKHFYTEDTCSKGCLQEKNCLGYYTAVNPLCTWFNGSQRHIVDLTAKTDVSPRKSLPDTRVYPFKLNIHTSSDSMKQEAGILFVRNITVVGLDHKLNCSREDKRPCEERCATQNSCLLAFQKRDNQMDSYCCGLVEWYNMPKTVQVSNDVKEYISFIKTDC